MQTVEPVFGQVKQGRGFRQFLLRGLEKVNGEWSLICTGHNLLKLFRSGADLSSEAGVNRSVDTSSPARRPHPVRSSCAASTNDLHTSSFHRSSATVSVGDGLKHWRHSTRSERPGKLMTPSLPTAPQVHGVDQSAREGSPRHFRQQDGKLSRRRSAGGCRFEGLLGSWVSIGARPGSTWKLRVRPWHALEYQRDPLSLITFRTEQVTNSLNS